MGYVYLLGNGNESFKIGVTRGSIEKRIKKLQTGNSDEIYMLDYFETDNPFLMEKMLHTKYAGKKIMNEWFNLNSEDIAEFKDICEELQKNIDALKDNYFFKEKLKKQ